METLAVGTLVDTRYGQGVVTRLPFSKRGVGKNYAVRMTGEDWEGNECFSFDAESLAPLVHGPEENPFALDLCEECHTAPKWTSIVRLCESCYGIAIGEIAEELAEEAPVQNSTVVPCPAFSFVLGFWSAELIYHHDTRNVTLESGLRIDYVEFEKEWIGASGNRVTELRAEIGFRWNVPTEAWEAIQKASAT